VAVQVGTELCTVAVLEDVHAEVGVRWGVRAVEVEQLVWKRAVWLAFDQHLRQQWQQTRKQITQ
jgi:hypothetical protein